MVKLAKIILLVIVSNLFMQCNKDYEILESIEGITITVDKPNKKIGETTVIKLINNKNQDLTDKAIFFVDGEEIKGNTFAKNVDGKFIITAKYESTYAENKVEVMYGNFISFRNNVLVEDYTGVWCGNCPRVVARLGQISESLGNNKDQLIAVAIHKGSSNISSGSYDPYAFNSDAYENAYFPGAPPKAAINRTIDWPAPQSNLNIVTQELQKIKQVGLALETKLTGNSLDVKVKVSFATNISNGKLVVYILENGLKHDQVNYSMLYSQNGSPINPIINFPQEHTLRLCSPPDMLGKLISGTSGTEMSEDYNFNLPSNYVFDNLEVVAFITSSDRTVINARNMKLKNSAPQSFQIIEN